MKIMSFNTQHCLNFITQEIDYEIMAKTINDYGAEIVGLNEMYSEGKGILDQASELSRLTGLKHHYFAEAVSLEEDGRPYGNALLSKAKILEAKTIKIPDPVPRKYNGYYETRCILKARLENGITVLVVHFGLNPDEQENAVKAILENIESEKCILMGDFNVPPTSEVLLPIREKMVDTATLMTDAGLSWPSDNPKLKIDYIFVSPDMKINSAKVLPVIASDHRPHVAEVEL